MRRGLGDAVSKGTLIEVPGFGALIKVPLEVSIKSVGARLECDETRVVAVHKWKTTIDERSLFIDGCFPLMCSDQGRRSTFTKPKGAENDITGQTEYKHSLYLTLRSHLSIR